MHSNEKIDRYAKWKEIIAEHENSGLSQIEFCKQRDLVASKFGYYRSVIKSQDKTHTNQKLFSAVQIKKSELGASSEIKIILPNGFQCVIPNAMDVLQVKRLVEALLSC